MPTGRAGYRSATKSRNLSPLTAWISSHVAYCGSRHEHDDHDGVADTGIRQAESPRTWWSWSLEETSSSVLHSNVLQLARYEPLKVATTSSSLTVGSMLPYVERKMYFHHRRGSSLHHQYPWNHYSRQRGHAARGGTVDVMEDGRHGTKADALHRSSCSWKFHGTLLGSDIQ
ncbi:hypothetical protein OsI_38860 [Oryza sativa Indica Group]|uniref:Uncharacterized protein n=1 Tax=Oryza sativa subsp. indica TaxID=39946 RepID=A2ZLZ9_ORYSI|nr:hypothetical protein OsI_38860 [Oryza sativa Indica Group]